MAGNLWDNGAMSLQSADIVGAFAQDAARAVSAALPGMTGLWGVQVGVVFPTPPGRVSPERVWLFPLALAQDDAAPVADVDDTALHGLDVQLSTLVAALYDDLVAQGGAVPTGMRFQVDVTDGATDLDFSYDTLDVAPLDPGDVGDWLDELFGE